jgi:hypothetical protein
MSITIDTLKNEREVLKKDFELLNNRIAQTEKDLGTMKSNLNAVFGAIQQVDKLINLSGGSEQKEKMSDEKQQALNLATS